MLSITQTVAAGVTPEGSETLPCEPKDHSKVGEGTLVGRGMGLISLAEHVSEKAFPTTPGPEGVRVTGLGE